jgi:hypothetical protein
MQPKGCASLKNDNLRLAFEPPPRISAGFVERKRNPVIMQRPYIK